MKIEKARKEAEKKRIIEERAGQRKDTTNANEGKIILSNFTAFSTFIPVPGFVY